MIDYGWYEITIGGTHFAVSCDDPIAVVRSDEIGTVQVTWSDLDAGINHPTMSLFRSTSGLWIIYSASETDPGVHSAVYLSATGDVSLIDRRELGQYIGASRHGLWLTTQSVPRADEEDEWIAPRQYGVMAPDGRIRVVTLDRVIVIAHSETPESGLLVYAGQPEFLPDKFGRPSHHYEMAKMTLPADLPDVIRASEFVPVPFDEAAFMARIQSRMATRRESRADDPRAHWSLAPVLPGEAEEAIAATLKEMSCLDSFIRGLRDAHVEVVGAWPRVQVVATFSHPKWNPSGRLRRTVDVFDRAGRIIDNQYASVHLMEDLATSPPKEPGEPVDGVMDF